VCQESRDGHGRIVGANRAKTDRRAGATEPSAATALVGEHVTDAGQAGDDRAVIVGPKDAGHLIKVYELAVEPLLAQERGRPRAYWAASAARFAFECPRRGLAERLPQAARPNTTSAGAIVLRQIAEIN
jgi:hypothetical protein